MSSALVFFRSWRFHAKLDEGHQLATGGPFRLVRHPIYAGLNLLALGSAIWAPSPIIWAGFALIAIGSDLRARSEEKLLERAFGENASIRRGRNGFCQACTDDYSRYSSCGATFSAASAQGKRFTRWTGSRSRVVAAVQ
jgi:hypothetical protein